MFIHPTHAEHQAHAHVVRFASNTQLEPDPLHVLPNADGVLEAHVGMLRNHHTYRIEIPRTHSLGPQITVHHPQPNIYVRVLDVLPTQNETDGRFTNVVSCQVKTIKEGSIAEKIVFSSDQDESRCEDVLVTAMVLGTNQGNPMLKTGVHVISHEHSEESDFTEWPGHGKEE